MDFKDDAEIAGFRDEVRTFIGDNLPGDWGSRPAGEGYDDYTFPILRNFQSEMAKKRWLTMAWPKEYGGLEAKHWQQAVMSEEMAYRRAPGSGANMGVQWVGPSLMLYGTDAQKQEHLQRIADADSWWCTLYSEPGSGSDLASLQTRAVADGDDYVINGQKIWTSGAHRADWGWLAARTDPDAPKHKGITMFMLRMDTPGVTVRPLINMADGHGFNEVFFEDVRVPKSNVVGEVNRGWYHLAVALDFERSGIGAFAGGRRTVEEITEFAADHPRYLQQRPHVRYELAERMIEVEVGTFMAYRIVHMQSQDIVANHEASMSKLFGSELGQRIARTGVALLGLDGGLWGGEGAADERYAALQGRLARSYVSSVSGTIAAGTSEIQRNIIATRGLGLPRG